MKARHQVGALLLAAALLTPGFAYQKGKPAPDRQPPGSKSFQPNRGPFGRSGDVHHRSHKAGSWLRKYNNLSPDEQQRALESDSKFQQLPPERQEKLRERLRRFNALPPEERERMIERMAHWEDMSPEQRQRWKEFQHRLRGMAPERSSALRQEFRSLKRMSPEERQQVFASERFQQDFSAEEKSLLQSMLEAADADARRAPEPDDANRF